MTLLIEALEGRQLLSSAEGIGALGDSYTDEYQFYPADRSTAQNYVEQLADDRRLEFGEFSSTPRGAPRNAGFAYNWAQSADTSADMLADGQLAGLAAQAAAGKVGLAFVFVGGNDFRGVFTAPDPIVALETVVPQAVNNIFTAVNSLLASSQNVNIVVATLPKVSVLPEVKAAVADGILPAALVSAVDFAIGAFNAQIRGLAFADSRVALADVDDLVTDILAPATFSFGGIPIDRETPSNDPTSLFLADGLHAGTIGQGLLANLFVSAANDEFGARIRPLREREILQNAGLSSAPHGHEHGHGRGHGRGSVFARAYPYGHTFGHQGRVQSLFDDSRGLRFCDIELQLSGAEG